MRRLLAVLALTAVLSTPSRAAAPPPTDPYLWLENVTGAKALEWVRARNAESTRELAESEAFKKMDARFLEILNSDARIPYVKKIGDSYYNFWRDKDHERGLWRRTTLAEYRKDHPAWETVLDLDALAKTENENWVWHGADALPPDYTRCLVSLSRGGADADVAREFDLTTKAFVKGGFIAVLRWCGYRSLAIGYALCEESSGRAGEKSWKNFGIFWEFSWDARTGKRTGRSSSCLWCTPARPQEWAAMARQTSSEVNAQSLRRVVLFR